MKPFLAAPMPIIERCIYLIRGQRVMLDSDLAELYNVPTEQLKRSVRRNWERFPEDFMFELSSNEYRALRCQIGILKRGGHSKFLPFAFTEQGVAMLSSVLHSKRAIQVNIAIVRAFIRLRELMAANRSFARKLAELERRISRNELDIKTVAQVIHDMMHSGEKPLPPPKPKAPIGFLPPSATQVQKRR